MVFSTLLKIVHILTMFDQQICARTVIKIGGRAAISFPSSCDFGAKKISVERIEEGSETSFQTPLR